MFQLPTIDIMKTVYRLKPLIFVRMIAEMVALLLCGTVPLIATIFGYLSKFPSFVQFGAVGVSVFAWIIFPIYGFITWAVISDQTGITVRSFFQKRFCKWEDIKSLKLLSRWNGREYVVATKQGDNLNFPVWLNNCSTLVEQIRELLPSSGEAIPPPTHFRHGAYPLGVLLLRTFFELVFAGVFWYFVFETFFPKSENVFDRVFVIAFAGLLSVGVLFRVVRIALMPFEIEISEGALVFKSPFYKLQLPWGEISKIIVAPPLLPEGYILKTKRGEFFISATIEASDELAAQIAERSGTALLDPAQSK
jgi:hypothetical protein